MHSRKAVTRGGRKLPPRTAPYIFAFYMSAIMAGLMSMVITGATYGFGEGYLANVIKAYLLAMPVAFVCVLVVKPIVVKLVLATVQSER